MFPSTLLSIGSFMFLDEDLRVGIGRKTKLSLHQIYAIGSHDHNFTKMLNVCFLGDLMAKIILVCYWCVRSWNKSRRSLHSMVYNS